MCCLEDVCACCAHILNTVHLHRPRSGPVLPVEATDAAPKEEPTQAEESPAATAEDVSKAEVVAEVIAEVAQEDVLHPEQPVQEDAGSPEPTPMETEPHAVVANNDAELEHTKDVDAEKPNGFHDVSQLVNVVHTEEEPGRPAKRSRMSPQFVPGETCGSSKQVQQEVATGKRLAPIMLTTHRWYTMTYTFKRPRLLFLAKTFFENSIVSMSRNTLLHT